MMKNRMCKLLSLVLAASMTFSLETMPVLAEEDDDSAVYQLEESSLDADELETISEDTAVLNTAKDEASTAEKDEAAAMELDVSSAMEPDEAFTLNLGGSLSWDVSSGDVIWVKVKAGNYAKKKTHIKVSVSGVTAYISGFYDLDNARSGSTFNEYNNISDSLLFPIAWRSSYYYFKIVAQGSGQMEVTGGTAAKEPELPKVDDDFCTNEALALYNTDILSVLEGMRSIRDNVLNQSSYGRQMSDYYYSISDTIVFEVLSDSAFRADMIEKADAFMPVIKEFVAISHGQPTGYVLTEDDYENIRAMKEELFSKLGDKDRTLGENLWNKLSLKDFVGRPFKEVVDDKVLTEASETDMAYCECMVYYDGDADIASIVSKVNDVLESNGINASVDYRESENLFGTDAKYVLEVNGFSDEDIIKDILTASNIFTDVEANYEVKALTNDVSYKYEWNLKNKGQKIPTRDKNGNEKKVAGKKNSDIKFENMKKYVGKQKTRKVKVAVIDTGINYTLADFQGIVDMKNAYNYISNNNDPMDDNNHGTHVSGVIAAKNGNGYSMAGICADAQILPIKALDANGSGDTDNLAKAVKYAVDKGAKVINMSLGIRRSNGDPVMPSECKEVEKAFKYAQKKGVTIVVAAGNESKNNLSYPANSKYTISVGAIDNKDKLAYFTNKGKGLDIVAPGVSIASLIKNGEVAFLSGTSMACPAVAGVVAQMYAVNSKMTPKKVAAILKKNSRDLGTKGYDRKFGAGCVNAYKAVIAARKGK
ncbi:MAG: S8 family serine peptidase [Lachnospiraceae bacterium]|nr:S8 family serine peptidase [Lachnospiraceae bacterium]